MKKMLIPCLMLTAVAANANVTDLNYQPAKDTIHIGSDLTYGTGEYTYTISTGSEKQETTNFALENEIAYGISKNLSASLGLNYDLIADTESPDSITKENGLKDPTVNFSYRALDNAPVTVDVNFGGVISLGEKEDNAYKGGHVVNVGADVSKKMGALELFSSLTFDYNLESESKDGATTTTYDPSFDINLDLAAQYMVAKNIYVNAAVNYGLIGEVEEIDTGETVKTVTESHSKYEAGLGAKYSLNKSLALNIAYNYKTVVDYDAKAGSATASTKDNTSHTGTVGVDYSF